jgi:hypothetical protein
LNAPATSPHATIDITPWTGETPDEILALGAREYSVAQAKAIVAHFADVSTSCHLDTFIHGFTEDNVTALGEEAGVTGRAALSRLMASRFDYFARPGTGFLCRKVLRSLNGPVFGVVWVNHWSDPETGQPKRSKGVEFWEMRDGLIARWDASINAWAITQP